jgi:hypothetical protein
MEERAISRRGSDSAGYWHGLVRLFPDTATHGNGAFGGMYRAPGTDVCVLCPVGASWGGGDAADPLAAWPLGDKRWRWLQRICDESERGNINRLKGLGANGGLIPTCPLAKVYYYLSPGWQTIGDGQAGLHRAEEIARQTLDPQRESSLAYFERALQVERDRREFVASLPQREAA